MAQGQGSFLNGIRFEKSVSVGNIFAVFTMMGGLLSSYYNIKYSILEDEKDRIALRAEFREFKADSLAVRGPALSSIVAINKALEVQTTRVDNLAEGMRQGRDTAQTTSVILSDVVKQQAVMHEDIALLKVKAK